MKNTFEKLTVIEATKLKKVLRKEQGSLTAAKELTGINDGTLRRAVARMNMFPKTVETIRTKLLS